MFTTHRLLGDSPNDSYNHLFLESGAVGKLTLGGPEKQ